MDANFFIPVEKKIRIESKMTKYYVLFFFMISSVCFITFYMLYHQFIFFFLSLAIAAFLSMFFVSPFVLRPLEHKLRMRELENVLQSMQIYAKDSMLGDVAFLKRNKEIFKNLTIEDMKQKVEKRNVMLLERMIVRNYQNAEYCPCCGEIVYESQDMFCSCPSVKQFCEHFSYNDEILCPEEKRIPRLIITQVIFLVTIVPFWILFFGKFDWEKDLTADFISGIIVLFPFLFVSSGLFIAVVRLTYYGCFVPKFYNKEEELIRSYAT